LAFFVFGDIMAGKKWTEEEIQYIKDNKEKSCKEIADHLGRTERSTQHKFGQLGLERRKAAVGDVVNGWKITDIYIKNTGKQNISMAKVESIICDKKAEYKLTQLTKGQVGWPDRRRPDLAEKNRTHGESGTRLHRIWKMMRARTSNPNADPNNIYFNKGIRCCKEWSDYTVFRDWAHSNRYSSELTLDRLDNDKDYGPENCRWSTMSEQARNKTNNNNRIITAFGETKDLYQWFDDDRCVVDIGTLRYRVDNGLDTKNALTKKSERSLN
jgi:hypothetical protein